MGNPKSQKKHYATPLRPWDRNRMEEESRLVKNYGLKSKKEVWKTETFLREFRREARKLMAATGKQADMESNQLLNKLSRMGLVEEDSEIVDVLRLDIENVLNRRLQSVVHQEGLARTPQQARQMVVHGHVIIGDKKITEPGYLISIEEEKELDHHANSSFKESINPEEIREE